MQSADLLGAWADSLGNAVHVYSQDAYEMKLQATLTKPPRQDIHLSVRQVEGGGGWQCGNSILDPVWTSEQQLHWVTGDGRVSVWVRLNEDDTKTVPTEGQPQEGTDADTQDQPQEGTE